MTEMTNADDFSYPILDYPFPDDFVAWYPYIKADVMRGNEHWLPCMRRVVLEDTPGVRDRMFTARDKAGRWAGVVWIQVPERCPELAHFGWFLVEDHARGSGVGGRIIAKVLRTLEDEGVRMIMLPTQLENERAIGMYWRRGWRLSMVDPNGGVWMTRDPEGFWASYYTPDEARTIEVGAPQLGDYVALDYLLSRPAAAIRLLPLGLTGNRRFVSFTHDRDAAEHAVARQDDRPVALAAAMRDDEGWLIDTFGLAPRPMSNALAWLADRVDDPRVEVAAADALRRQAVEDAGFRRDGEIEREISGCAMMLLRYRR